MPGRKYNRIIPLFSHVAPLIPAERHVHVHLPSTIHVDPQGAEMVCRALYVEQIRSLGHIAEDEFIIALDERAFGRTGGGQG